MSQGNLIKHMESCNGDMHHTAPVDIQEPEGSEIEICTIVADPSDDMDTSHPMIQSPRASIRETVMGESQMIQTFTPDHTPEPTDPQVENAMGDDVGEIDVVSVEEVEPNDIETTLSVSDEIGTTEETGNSPTEPPNIHRHYTVKAMPVKVKKIKLKRIELKKLRPPNETKGYSYGLPLSSPKPPQNSPIKI